LLGLFLTTDDILPRRREAEIALHNGDAGPRRVLWSHDDPVTLFGAEVNRTGRPELGPTFDWLATRFTECTSLEYEIVAAGASGDLAYLVAIERISASANGGPASYVLRATTILRRKGSVEGRPPPRRPLPAGLGDLGAACSRWTSWRFGRAGFEAGGRLGGAGDLTTAPPPRPADVWHHTARVRACGLPGARAEERKWPQSRAKTC
jgi:ketosteroid isomerase-like protein